MKQGDREKLCLDDIENSNEAVIFEDGDWMLIDCYTQQQKSSNGIQALVSQMPFGISESIGLFNVCLCREPMRSNMYCRESTFSEIRLKDGL